MHETLEEIQTSSRKPIDGNLKVYFSLFSLFFVVLSNSMAVYITALLLFSILALYSAGRSYIKLMKIPTYFLIPSALIIAYFIPGNEISTPFPINPTDEGLKLASTTVLRSYASLSILSFLVLTTTIPEMFAALKKLKLPGFIVEMSLLIYRTIQVLMDELERLDRSASSRLGYSSRKAFLRTSSLLAYSLFIKSLQRSEKMNLAMESRCYAGNMPVKSGKSSGYFLSLVVAALLIVSWVGL